MKAIMQATASVVASILATRRRDGAATSVAAEHSTLSGALSTARHAGAVGKQPLKTPVAV